jgi:hypothetical protein
MMRPLRSATSPAFRSSPASRTFWPVFCPAAKVTAFPAAFARSCMTTVSAPSGTTPPVMMRTHCPGPTFPLKGLPAKATPISCSVASRSAARSAPRIAQPSIAELRCEGTFTGERMSSASTRPRLLRTGTRITPLTGARNWWMKARAFATGIEFGS